MNIPPSRGFNNTDNSNFTDFRAIISKYLFHWPLFLTGFIIAIAGAYAYLQFTDPVYEISATILVKDEKKSPQDESSLPEIEQSASPKNAETEIEILRSKTLVSEVVDDLQLWATYKFKEGLEVRDLYTSSPAKLILVQKDKSLKNESLQIFIKDKNTYEFTGTDGKTETSFFNKEAIGPFGTFTLEPTKYLSRYIGSSIIISLDEKANVTNDYVKSLDAHLLDKLAPTIGLFISDKVPERGTDFLDRLLQGYNDAASEEQKRTTKSTIDFIDRRLASLTGELDEAEQEVESFRSSEGLTDINSQAKVYLENVQTNDIKLNEVNVQLNVIEGIERYVNSPSNSGNAPATIGISDPALNSMIEKLSELQLRRSALLSNTPEQNPIFNPINEQIALTKKAIRENIRSIKSSLLSTKRGLQSFNNKFESSIRDIPVQERQFVGMKRQQSIKENLYVYLLQKREELSLSYASKFVDARIVDKASVGDIIWPRIPLILMVALVAGLGVPFLIIYFRDSFANKITTRREIELATGSPVLEELSYEDMNDDTLVLNIKKHFIGEQFRSLRTNLNYLHDNAQVNNSAIQHSFVTENNVDALTSGSRGRITLLTSSISKEGKSFVSTNLAVSLSVAGKKTVILEMDLRKPRISTVFGLSYNHAGISEYLTQGLSVESIIQPSGNYQNLDVIGSGSIPEEPSELLESERLARLFEELKERYDHIIIDTPPVHLVTDAMIIAPHSDVSLYVIRQGYTGKDELRFIREIYQSEKLPNFQIIFNGIKKQKYGYGYSYDNSYYSIQTVKKPFKTKLKQFLNRF